MVPLLDLLFSYILCLELFRFCHHTVVLDDVHSVDAKGIPRRKDGRPVMIWDVSNTIGDLIDEMKPTGVLLSFPFFMMNQGVAMFIPLAEYGDTPTMLRRDFVGTEKDRDAVVQRVEAFHKEWERTRHFNI